MSGTTAMYVTLQQVTVMNIREGSFVVEASCLGLPPGRFPKSFDTDMGNKQPLRLIRITTHAAVYKQDNGPTFLHVLND